MRSGYPFIGRSGSNLRRVLRVPAEGGLGHPPPLGLRCGSRPRAASVARRTAAQPASARLRLAARGLRCGSRVRGANAAYGAGALFDGREGLVEQSTEPVDVISNFIEAALLGIKATTLGIDDALTLRHGGPQGLGLRLQIVDPSAELVSAPDQ